MGNPSNSMKCPEILDIDSHIYLSLPKKAGWIGQLLGETNHPNVEGCMGAFGPSEMILIL